MNLRWICVLVLALGSLPAWAGSSKDIVWDEVLRKQFFGDRPIAESDEVVELDTPVRAENAALVPIVVRAHAPQRQDLYIRAITIVIDKNPTPLAGRFELTPLGGRADLAMRVRVNEYTPIRAIAEMSDGTLHMSRRFVKASGGCSAPAGSDLKAAQSQMGQMRLRAYEPGPGHREWLVQLGIRHPNLTGLQMNQLTQLIQPAHFITGLEVTYAGRPLLRATTDISISENPNFRFHLLPKATGTLRVVVTDSEGNVFEKALAVNARPGS